MLVAATNSQLLALDPANGNIIKSYKACEAQDITVSPYGILAAQTNKPLIFQFGKKESNLKKIVLPEKIATLKVSPCFKYLICGAISGRILLWSLESGQLLAAQDAHFQQVTCLAWSDDSARIVSGGADARLLVWKLFDLVTKDLAEPVALSGHSLAITDVQFGKGQWREARLFTSSKDSTVCVYGPNLDRLTTFTLSDPVHKLCVDPVERAIYAATSKGVAIILLYNIVNGRLHASGGLGDIIGCENCQILESEPTSLKLENDATLLYVGDAQGVVTTWDVGTKQVVRRSKPLRGAVHSIELGEFEPLEVPQLKRIVGEATDLILEHSTEQISLEVTDQDVLECWQGVQVSAGASAAPVVDTSALENEVAQLKKKNKELQELYDKLWQESQ